MRKGARDNERLEPLLDLEIVERSGEASILFHDQRLWVACYELPVRHALDRAGVGTAFRRRRNSGRRRRSGT
jgi:hypothetical protein